MCFLQPSFRDCKSTKLFLIFKGLVGKNSGGLQLIVELEHRHLKMGRNAIFLIIKCGLPSSVLIMAFLADPSIKVVFDRRITEHDPNMILT